MAKMYGKAVKDMVDAWSSWKAYETLHKKKDGEHAIHI